MLAFLSNLAGARQLKANASCADNLHQVIVCPVKRLLQIFTVVLAFAWVPITSHCAWENTPGLEFFKCADDAVKDSQKARDSQKDDCADDACSTLEGGSYKVSETQTAVPAPSLTILFLQPSLLDIVPVEQPSFVTAAPPEIPVSWKFFSRTALPPRAPSLA